jgi:chemotaxis protein methyltransferase CheR
MTPVFVLADVERFRGAVARHLGLHFDDTKLAFLEDVLRRRVEAGGGDAERYLLRLEPPEAPGEELVALAQDLTVAETYFFRHREQFQAFAGQALPDRMRARLAERRLRLLSAGCATGEEAYSLAMVIRETLADLSWDVEIRGIDINPAVLEKAARGRYPAWSLRETPPAARQRWFRPEERDFLIDEMVRASVVFQPGNLARDDAGLWQPGAYDVVFCRNVLMYMTPQSAQEIVARIARVLAPGGYLFLGHAETLRGLSQSFHLCHTHGTFYYRRREAEEAATATAETPATPAAPRPRERVRPLVAAVEGGSWRETIQRTAERIEALAVGRGLPAPLPAGVADRTRPAWDLGAAFDLLRGERFAEALALVRALPAESGHDADVLLLQAVLLTQGGQLAEAEAVCRRLLTQDDLNAGAHYVLALCRESAADTRGAIEHDQTAVYLDAGFAMPRLHLGLLARRGGDREAARRELTQALTLLQREDASRLLLFGGGFSREALIALCHAELSACGAAS